MRHRVTVGGVPVSILDAILFGIVLVLVGGCAPQATAGLNAVVGGPAELVYVVNADTPCGDTGAHGLCFMPNDADTLGVLVTVRSRTGVLTALDSVCTSEDWGAVCALGDVTVPTFVLVNGEAVQASATYRLPDSARVYTEFATF